MRILFHPANAVHVFMLQELRRYCASRNIATSAYAFHLDQWWCLGAVESLRDNNIDFTGLPNPEGRSVWRLDDWGQRAIRDSYYKLEDLFRGTIENFHPDVFLIFGDGGIFEAGMLRMCRLLNVPSVFIQEGYIPVDRFKTGSNTLSFLRRFLRPFKRGIMASLTRVRHRTAAHRVPTSASEQSTAEAGIPQARDFGLNGADAIAAINFKDAKWFVDNGVCRDHVTVTGHLLMDRLWRFVNTHANSPGTSSVSRGADSSVHLLIVSSGSGHFGMHEQHRWFVEQIRDMVKATASKPIGIRLRLKPGESIDDWKNVWRDVQEAVEILPNCDNLYHQIQDTDLTLAFNSQALIEALMIGKPVINLAPQGVSDPFGLVDRGVALSATSAHDLVRIVEDRRSFQLAEKQKYYRDRCYQDLFYHFDGKAAERICAVIEKVRGLTLARD